MTETRLHECPGAECEATHRDQGIWAWHPAGQPNITQFLPPEYTPETIEQNRLLMARWWGCPEEAVVSASTSAFAYRLAPGWRRVEEVVRESDNVISFVSRIERVPTSDCLPGTGRGCCTACGGTGRTDSAPETGGRCWDCLGTGHVHDPEEGCSETAPAADSGR